MTDLANPHDRFLKALTDNAASAAALLRERLPPAIAARLADEPPELVPGSFVSADMAEYHSDRLFRARLKGGGPVLLYVLVEHKSARDRRVSLQLLRYLVRIWNRPCCFPIKALDFC